MLSLARLLRKYTPTPASPDLSDCAATLDAAIEAGAQAYADRIRQDQPSLAQYDSEDDGTVDALLAIVRDRVEHWRVFARPTYVRLAEGSGSGGQAADVDGLIERGREAERIHALLFAADFDATRAPYPEQAEYMLALERIVVQAGVAGILDELVRGPFVAELGRANLRYQAMVARRAAAERAPEINFHDVLARLRTSIQNYLIAVLAMIRDDDPDNVATMRRALRPVDALREQLSVSAGRARDTDAGASDPEAIEAVEELVAEQQAVDAELGLSDLGVTPPDGLAFA